MTKNIIPVGIITGFTVATLVLPGGFDGYNFYLRPYHEFYPIPYWGYQLLSGFGQLSWPYSWMFLVLITSIVLWLSTTVFKTNFYLTICSLPVIINLWLGQIEIISLVCVLLVYLILEKRINQNFSFIPVLLGLLKPQVTGVILLFFLWELFKADKKTFFIQNFVVLIFVGQTFIVEPAWFINWINWLKIYPTINQVPVFDYGILFLPLIFWPIKNLKHRLVLLSALSNLVFPFFRLYRATIIIPLFPSLGILSWLFWGDPIIFLLVVLFGVIGVDLWQRNMEFVKTPFVDYFGKLRILDLKIGE